MKKVLYYMAYYLVGLAWMCTGILAIGYMAAPEMFDAPQAVSYIKSAAWGAISFALLGVLCWMEGKNDASIFRK